MNIDEQTRHPKTEWYKKLTIHRKGRQWKYSFIVEYRTVQKKISIGGKKKTAVEDQISDKKQKGY